MIEIVGLDHIVLRTSRMEEMLHFYGAVLGGPAAGHQQTVITTWITFAYRLTCSLRRRSAVTWSHTVSRWGRSSAATGPKVMAIPSTYVIPRAIVWSCATGCRPECASPIRNLAGQFGPSPKFGFENLFQFFKLPQPVRY